MGSRGFMQLIFKVVAIALAVASIILLIVGHGDTKTILTTLSISLVCTLFSQIDRKAFK